MDTKHDNRHSHAGQRGLTLVEVMIVVVVMVIAAATAAPSLANLVDGRRLDAAANQLAADIQLVRTEAVAPNRPIRLSFHSDAGSSCWIVHTGTAAQCSCDSSGGPACTAGAIEIKTVVIAASDRVGLQTNVASMLFDPLHGTATPPAPCVSLVFVATKCVTSSTSWAAFARARRAASSAGAPAESSRRNS
ncbi:MAG: GspH/FimT family pseudopilin [Pseudomonadota bacterium]|nr:GspH/FimT family pseudopilin [Pseudomonadota bacterium]